MGCALRRGRRHLWARCRGRRRPISGWTSPRRRRRPRLRSIGGADRRRRSAVRRVRWWTSGVPGGTAGRLRRPALVVVQWRRLRGSGFAGSGTLLLRWFGRFRESGWRRRRLARAGFGRSRATRFRRRAADAAETRHLRQRRLGTLLGPIGIRTFVRHLPRLAVGSGGALRHLGGRGKTVDRQRPCHVVSLTGPSHASSGLFVTRWGGQLAVRHRHTIVSRRFGSEIARHERHGRGGARLRAHRLPATRRTRRAGLLGVEARVQALSPVPEDERITFGGERRVLGAQVEGARSSRADGTGRRLG